MVSIEQKKERLLQLHFEIDMIIQKVELLKRIQVKKNQELSILKEVVEHEQLKALAIKDEYEAIMRIRVNET